MTVYKLKKELKEKKRTVFEQSRNNPTNETNRAKHEKAEYSLARKETRSVIMLKNN
jgi:hypothetical protein